MGTIAEVLWRNALLLVPLAMIVAILSRSLTWRPGTRYVLWLVVILWLGCGPFLPSPPRWEAGTGPGNRPLPADSFDLRLDVESDAAAARYHESLAQSHVEGDELSSESGPPVGEEGIEMVPFVPELERGLVESIGAVLAWVTSPLPPAARIPQIAGIVTGEDAVPVRIDEDDKAVPDNWVAAQSTPQTQLENNSNWETKNEVTRADATNPEPLAQASVSVGSPFSSSSIEESQAELLPPPIEPAVETSTELPIAASVLGESAPEKSTGAMDTRMASQAEAHGSPREEEKFVSEPASQGSFISAATGFAGTAWAALIGAVGVGASSLREAVSSQTKPWFDAVGRLWHDVSHLPAIPLPVWVGGLMLLVTWKTLATLQFRRCLRRGTIAPADVQDLVQSVGKKLGLRRIPRVLLVDARVSPMIWVGRRPVLILPVELWNQYDPVARRAVVCHELAHLHRRDHWIMWFEQFVGCLYWWHPVVWWIRRRLHEEMESSCDLWVTWLMPEGRRTYAQALLQTRQYLGAKERTVYMTGMGVFTGRAGRIARRLTMVMTKRERPGASIPGVMLALALAAGAWLLTPAPLVAEETAPPVASVGTGSVPFAAAAISGEAAPVAAAQGVVVADARDEGRRRARAPRARAGEPSNALEDRLDELEARLEKLTQQLEKMSEGMGKSRVWVAPAPPVPAVPPAPQVPPVPGVPKAPAAPKAGSLFPSPPKAHDAPGRFQFNAGSAFWSNEGKTVERTYALSEGKLEALTKLMSRSDVPVLIRPGKDEITVIATEPVQHVFESFVQMIDPGENRWEDYKLSEGKLKDLTELMARPDVPVLIRPDDEAIHFQGTDLQQSIFADFVGIIEGKPAPHVGTIRRLGKTSGEMKKAQEFFEQSKIERKEKEKQVKRSREARRAELEAARGARRAARAYGIAASPEWRAEIEKDIQAALEAVPRETMAGSQQAAEVVEQLRKAIAANAGQWDHDQLVQHIKQAAAAHSQFGDQQRAALEVQVQALMESSRALERKARELEKKAEQLEREADKVEERAGRIDEQAEELREKADATPNDAERGVLDRELEQLNVMFAGYMDDYSALGQRASDIYAQAEQVGAQAERLAEFAEALEDAAAEMKSAPCERLRGQSEKDGCVTPCPQECTQPCSNDSRVALEKQ